MARFEAKMIQKELDSAKLRPVYWLFGTERMMIRELIRRIQKAALSDQPMNDFNFEKIDGSEVDASTIMDSAQGLSLMGGAKIVLVRNAEEIKNLEALSEFLESMEESQTVLVFVSKGFDSRKKVFKKIQEQVATVGCDKIPDEDRESWIQYLAQRREIPLKNDERTLLEGLEPWSLDIVDQELSKMELVKEDEKLRKEVILNGVDIYAREEFMDALFCRDRKRALHWMHPFCDDTEIQLLLLGLVAWNLRHLKLVLMEEKTRSRSGEKRNYYLQKKLERWKRHWSVQSLQEFEHRIFDMDLSLKSKGLLGKGLWTSLL